MAYEMNNTKTNLNVNIGKFQIHNSLIHNIV